MLTIIVPAPKHAVVVVVVIVVIVVIIGRNIVTCTV